MEKHIEYAVKYHFDKLTIDELKKVRDKSSSQIAKQAAEYELKLR